MIGDAVGGSKKELGLGHAAGLPKTGETAHAQHPTNSKARLSDTRTQTHIGTDIIKKEGR